MNKTTRVATVKATGERFVVLNLDFAKNQVVCQPDVYSYAADRKTLLANVAHINAPAQRFSIDAVTLENVVMDLQLAKALLAQSQAKVKPREISAAEREVCLELAKIVAKL
jgi:hypothetical protein